MNRYLRGLAKRWGNTRVKKRAWDEEYGNGHWRRAAGSQQGAPRNQVYGIIDKYARGGAILDLGCGSGIVAFETSGSYGKYIGVDISSVVIQEAETEVRKRPDLALKVSFHACDISRFSPDITFSIIVFSEVLYYFPKNEMGALLRYYGQFLSNDGVFVARLHDRRRYKPILDVIESQWQVIETLTPSCGTSITVVFRPKAFEL